MTKLHLMAWHIFPARGDASPPVEICVIGGS
jgi:hypothetical protein